MISAFWKRFVLLLVLLPAANAQNALTGVEPGLEEATKWKWSVSSSDPTAWGLELPELPSVAPAASPGAGPTVLQANSYEVRKGDALILIAKKHGRTVAQLKAANGLKNDIIRAGDILKIPTLEECIALGLPPEPVLPKKAAGSPSGQPAPTIDSEALILQVFLDRKNLSAGPIDAKSSPAFQKLVYLYQTARGVDTLPAEARAAVTEPTTKYVLKAEDFRFIAPPKAEKPAPPSKAGKNAPQTPPPPSKPVYSEMTAARMLAYQTPWEFVAERFHTDEALLKALNPSIKNQPLPGTEFVVPNVTPFEIENSSAAAFRPPADPLRVRTAVIVDLTRMEIYENSNLIAIFPVSPARPGLRGRGTWKILDSIVHPKLATLRESKDPPKPVSSFFTGENPPPPTQTLTTEEFLPPGPNNPAGIIWINLSKTDPPEILPYGLHGTGIPGKMTTLASIGGFRMSNWDILRAAALLPEGTPLLWRQHAMPGAAPAAVPAAVPAVVPPTSEPAVQSGNSEPVIDPSMPAYRPKRAE